MFFSEIVVFTEGLEDVAFISAYLELMGLYDDFSRLGCHFVPTGGKSRIVEPLAVAKALKIPAFVVFDSDGDEKSPGNRVKHEKDNRDILSLCSSAALDLFPKETHWSPNCVMWNTNIQSVAATEVGEARWREIKDKIRQEQHIDIKDVEKHGMLIADCLALAWMEGFRFQSLDRLCKSICAFASEITKRPGPKAALNDSHKLSATI